MKRRLEEWRGDVRQGREERRRKGGTEDVDYRGYCKNWESYVRVLLSSC